MRMRFPGPAWSRWPFWPLALVAVAVWLLAWGPCAAPWHTACFTNGGWGDHKHHYQGWITYLHSPVWLPPTSRAFTWPFTSSVMFTDSVPLAAILFKPLTRLLHLGDWQYLSALSLANGLLISGSCSPTPSAGAGSSSPTNPSSCTGCSCWASPG
jgi:hypothetical protein